MKGSSSFSGPPPDPSALRRDRDKDGWRELPASGRVGAVPDWHRTRASTRELLLWKHEWRRPQAIVWEENSQQAEVAIYVRTFAAAEKPGAPVSIRTLLKQQQDALGPSLPGMLRLRWRIAGQPVARVATRTDGPSAKDRWKVLDDGG